jgi:hypothetical protein
MTNARSRMHQQRRRYLLCLLGGQSASPSYTMPVAGPGPLGIPSSSAPMREVPAAHRALTCRSVVGSLRGCECASQLNHAYCDWRHRNPEAGFEPAPSRARAERSSIDLLRSIFGHSHRFRPMHAGQARTVHGPRQCRKHARGHAGLTGSRHRFEAHRADLQFGGWVMGS